MNRLDNQEQPLVSIGLPAYNGEDFIGQTLSSLLAQDYKNFELIISDDASRDGTAEICNSYAKQDHRIRYCRNVENIGLIQNWNRLVKLSKGRYFMWAGQHDLWDSSVIRSYVKELEGDKTPVLAFGRYDEIDEKGNFIKAIPVDLDTHGLKPGNRLKRMIGNFGCPFGIYGLIRADALRKTRLLLPTAGTDFIFMAELAIQGEFHFVPAAKTYIRAFYQRKMSSEENVIRLIGARNAQDKKGKRTVRFPYLVSTLDMLHVVKNADLSSKEKLKLAWMQLGCVSTGLLKEFTFDSLPKTIRLWLRRMKNLVYAA